MLRDISDEKESFAQNTICYDGVFLCPKITILLFVQILIIAFAKNIIFKF